MNVIMKTISTDFTVNILENCKRHRAKLFMVN